MAKVAQESEQTLYREYVTDALKLIAENTAKIPYVGGAYMQVRYGDIIKPKPVERRTAREIIEEISAKLDIMGRDKLNDTV